MLERLPESRVQLEIEVDEERLEKKLEATYRRVASKARIAGFRPGKAPRPVVMQRIGGRQGLIREAIDSLVPDVYNEAIESEEVEAIGQPELEILELDPVRFKATVPVKPTVTLNDYRSVRVERQPVEVTEADISDQLLALRRRLALHVPVDRPARWGDFIIADIRATSDDAPVLDDTDVELQLREGEEIFMPGLAEAFVGMERGATKETELPFPGDFRVERLQGKAATLVLAIQEIKEEELPAEDDDLAREVSEDLETLAALKERIRKDLQDNRAAAEDARVRSAALDELVSIAVVDYPRLIVEREIDHMVREGIGSDTAGYERYLQSVGRTHAEFRETFRPAAEERVRRSLVLNQLAEAEGISVSDEEIEAEIARLAGPMGDDAGRFREIFAGEAGRDSIRHNLLTQRTFERVLEFAAVDPEPARASRGRGKKAAGEPAPGKARATRAKATGAEDEVASAGAAASKPRSRSRKKEAIPE